jgi:hypothetical protein
MGDTCHLKLNMSKRPIANKYREGKMKRTLKRESKVREIGIRETIHAAPGRDAPGSTSQEAGPYGAPDPVDPLGAACTCAEGRWLRFGGCFIDLGPRQALPQVSPFGEAGTNGPEPSS